MPNDMDEEVKNLSRAEIEFQKLEGRADFFTLAENICKDHLVEAVIIILGTWNFAVFRYHVQNFDIENTNRVLESIQRNLKTLEGESIKSIDLAKHKDPIIKAFDQLSAIKGIEYTGASKVLHLLNKELFVMWDGYIRGEKQKRYYDSINVKIKKYGKDGESYFKFLEAMQDKYQETEWRGTMTLARAIDAYNYVNITLEIQKIEKIEAEYKKAIKKEDRKKKKEKPGK